MPKLVKNSTKKCHPYEREAENSRKALKSAFRLWTECAKVYQAQTENYYMQIKQILAAEFGKSTDQKQRIAERIGNLFFIFNCI